MKIQFVPHREYCLLPLEKNSNRPFFLMKADGVFCEERTESLDVR
jgi:hypothetical protein